MATGHRATPGRGARRVSLAVVATVLALVSLLPAMSLGAAPLPASSALTTSSSGVAATVTWNGANILNYSSATSAARIGFNAVVDVHYAWSSSNGATPYTINDARLQIFYFGFALATRDIVNSAATPTTSGSFDMNWSTGALQYILEGSYKLVASLLAPNGTTMWSQTFWSYVAAPFYVGALLPIILILLVIWEVYNIATVGRQAALGKRPPSSAPPAEPASEPTDATDTATSPPSDEAAPPSGGST